MGNDLLVRNYEVPYADLEGTLTYSCMNLLIYAYVTSCVDYQHVLPLALLAFRGILGFSIDAVLLHVVDVICVIAVQKGILKLLVIVPVHR